LSIFAGSSECTASSTEESSKGSSGNQLSSTPLALQNIIREVTLEKQRRNNGTSVGAFDPKLSSAARSILERMNTGNEKMASTQVPTHDLDDLLFLDNHGQGMLTNL